MHKCLVLTLLALLCMLAGCAADGTPYYCNQGIVERAGPAMGGPGGPLTAIFVSGVMEIGCIDFDDDDGQPTSPSRNLLTCSTLGLNKPQSSAIASTDRFSVIPPEGSKWCAMPQKLGMIGFVTHPKMGHLVERPSPAMSQNTIALAAYSVQLDGHDVRSRDDFLKLAKGWVESGMGTQFDGVNVTLTDQADPRYRVLNANVSPAHLQDDWCVSYEYRGEERKNPVSPNVVFEQEDFGQLCLEPKFKKYMVHMSLSERFGKGKRLSPNLLEKIFIADAKPFFESLKFVE